MLVFASSMNSGARQAINAPVDGYGVVRMAALPHASFVHQRGMTIVPRSAKRLVFRVGRNAQPIFAKKVTIPARPFIGLSADNLKEIVEELNAMFEDLFGGGA